MFDKETSVNDALEQKKLALPFPLGSGFQPTSSGNLTEEAKLPGFLHLDDRSQGKKVPQTEEATPECPHKLCCPQTFSGAIAVVRPARQRPGRGWEDAPQGIWLSLHREGRGRSGNLHHIMFMLDVQRSVWKELFQNVNSSVSRLMGLPVMGVSFA